MTRGTLPARVAPCLVVSLLACSSGSPPESLPSTTTTTSSSEKGQAPTEVDRERAYTLFETGQVRPLALSPSGEYLYATNTPDNRLEIFRVLPSRRLKAVASVPVGLEPVAVASRVEGEVWVVNHL